MLAVIMLLGVAASSCKVDHHLLPVFADWRHNAHYGSSTRPGISGEINEGILDYRELPDDIDPSSARSLSVSRSGTYAVAKSSNQPVTFYSDVRDAAGQRIAIRPFASRGGLPCSTIVGVDFFRLPAGHYYLTVAATYGPTRTLVRLLN